MEVLKIKDWLLRKKRRIFYINVSPNSMNDIELNKYMRQVANRLKRRPLIDPETGNINLKYSSMNIQEDYYI